ncbi:EamA family transporter RarD [Sanguibacter antarcticus]|uniref:Chloramphenicol-sensitive protein RarD n=1 Tax=Sanguibacter antarcticus TaxID=372484 RepID=A0A2A9E617_9MICO|nr:EamA family transporter RarD [Sanguibacter antarcticus]PFG34096.1 chloramphenicol-sensitive protein RarD [Sanguibacter antarcticus]
MTQPGSTPAPRAAAPLSHRAGLVVGIATYGMWGTLPLYFPLLQPASALEIIAHRIVWSLVFCALLLGLTRQLGAYTRILRSRRLVGTLTVAAVLVAVNWIIYVYGVTTGHVVDAALGYFINPLVTVLLAVVVLKERLRPAQWVALSFGAVAVVVITAGLGRVPWISLGLAASFGVYGLIKNRVGRDVAALPGLAVETTVLAPVALGYILWLTVQGTSTFGTEGTGHALLLASAGIVTALPLLSFGAAARVLPLRVIGMLQYIAPIMQFLIGVLVFHEAMPTVRWIGFSLVWLALAILTVDALRAVRASRLAGRGRAPASPREPLDEASEGA